MTRRRAEVTKADQFPSDAAIGEPTVRVGALANRSPILRSIRLAIGPYPARITVLAVLALVAGVLDALVLFAVARLGLLLAGGATDSAHLELGPLGTYDLDFAELVLVTSIGLVIVTLLQVPIAHITGSLCRSTLIRSRRRMLSAYLRASWGHRSAQDEGRLHEYMMTYAKSSESVVLQIATMIVMLWSIVAIGIASIVLAGWAALGGAAGMFALALALRPLTQRVKTHSSMQAHLNQQYSAMVAQTARVAPEIATFDVAEAVSEAGRKASLPAGDSVARLRFFSKSIPMLFQYAALAIVMAMLYIVYTFDLGDLSAVGPLVVLLLRALFSLKQLQTSTQLILQIYPFVDGLEAEIADLNAHPMPRGTVDVARIGTIRFEGVGFHYVPGQPVLCDVDLEIEEGEAIGIVGPSGGGKSTLSQLFTGLRSPTSGRIMVGDVDLHDATVHSWARLMALVPQDNALIRASVADNIRFFRSDFSDDEVQAAARGAHLHHDIVSQLPEDYETIIGPGERELSGGQRQRLGIARALLGRPRLLVLDEPTSALDGHSEELIRQTLEELKGTTTLVVIAHRPSTLRICDRVFQVEKGTVREVAHGSTEVRSLIEELGAEAFEITPEWGPPLPDGRALR
jgi:ABC-type multidrug transport system fused ATPase/permease subunit